MSDEKKPFHNPFGALAGLKDALPRAPERPAPPPKEKPGPAKAVVRLERKGRGGKEVTLVEQLGLPAKELEQWLKAMKSGLGCGGVVEEGALVLQGDQRDRAAEWLTKRGVKQVIAGN